ncbi:HAD-IC family P-type ATPase [Streptomyces sp. NPDC050610]|uniref:HAD-IC family P-type ATPase n=1 Tax=Streptomyces sp. NPDC050610 TaxID=3157097 RepID=UPI0034371454
MRTRGAGSTLQALRALESGPRGLLESEAAERLALHGGNTVPGRRPTPWPRRFARSLRDPFTAVLLCLGLISATAASWGTSLVIAVLVTVSCALRSTGEHRADRSAAALRSLVATTATVQRRQDEAAEAAPPRTRELPVDELVPGDVIRLGPGDLIPADVRLLRATGLTVHQAALTGESVPVAKHAPDAAGRTGVPPKVSRAADAVPFDQPHLCFQGSSVASGSGTALVVATGSDTVFSGTYARRRRQRPATAFDRSVNGISWTLIRFMLLTAPLVLLVNALVRGRGMETLPFAVAVAVGLTPEMLPVIVTTALARGAARLARGGKVIVRRLPALHDLGAADVLCIDKTGTLTQDRPAVDRAVDADGAPDPDVLHWAAVNALWTLQLAELPAPDALDEAILDADEEHGSTADDTTGIDALPFDAARRLSTAVVRAPGGRTGQVTLVVKGAVEDVLERCSHVAAGGAEEPDGAGPHARRALGCEEGARTDVHAAEPLGPGARGPEGAVRPYGVERGEELRAVADDGAVRAEGGSVRAEGDAIRAEGDGVRAEGHAGDAVRPYGQEHSGGIGTGTADGAGGPRPGLRIVGAGPAERRGTAGARALDDGERARLARLAEESAADGLRVLAVALADRPARGRPFTTADERGLTFIGFVCLRDTPAPTAADALAVLARRGVDVKVLTGDHPGTAARACRDLGLEPGEVVTAARIDASDDAALAELAAGTTVFARCSPEHKARVVAALRSAGHTTGFLGDGVNDLAALHAADVGICPRDAVDVTREAADVVLASKDLTDLDQAIVTGRRSTVNIAAYLRITLSSNFGNVIAMLAAGLMLPFLPMLPAQVLVQNLCFDAAQLALAFDRPGPGAHRRPTVLRPRALTRFVSGFGLLNACADLATFGVLALAVPALAAGAGQEAFHAGWFTENLLTQALVILLLRSGRRASVPVRAATAALAVLALALPLSPLAPALGMTALPPLYYGLMAVVLSVYGTVLALAAARYDRRAAAREAAARG